MSDPLAGGQAQEKGEGGCKQGAGRQPDDVRPREVSGRWTMQKWRVCCISAVKKRLKKRRGVRLTLLLRGSKCKCECVCLAQIIKTPLSRRLE